MKFQYIKDKVSTYFTKGNERSVAVKKNIAVSLVLKCISILVSLQVVPLTIGYVNPTKYGIWLTLSSIIAWLSYFDLGFAHGFRNRFAEAKAKGDMKLAKEYVSTTYAVLFLLFSVILLITLVVNNYLDWSRILNIDPVYKDELSLVFGLLACFFCLNIVASVFTTMLTADQKPALASLISTSGQVLAFACVLRCVTFAFRWCGVLLVWVDSFLLLCFLCFLFFNLLISFCQECKAQKQLRNIILLISILMYLTWLQILF